MIVVNLLVKSLLFDWCRFCVFSPLNSGSSSPIAKFNGAASERSLKNISWWCLGDSHQWTIGRWNVDHLYSSYGLISESRIFARIHDDGLVFDLVLLYSIVYCCYHNFDVLKNCSTVYTCMLSPIVWFMFHTHQWSWEIYRLQQIQLRNHHREKIVGIHKNVSTVTQSERMYRYSTNIWASESKSWIQQKWLKSC